MLQNTLIWTYEWTDQWLSRSNMACTLRANFIQFCSYYLRLELFVSYFNKCDYYYSVYQRTDEIVAGFRWIKLSSFCSFCSSKRCGGLLCEHFSWWWWWWDLFYFTQKTETLCIWSGWLNVTFYHLLIRLY